MKHSSWKEVVFQWVRKINFCEVIPECLEDAKPEDFFVPFAQKINHGMLHYKTKKNPLLGFLKVFYPDFKPLLNEDGDINIDDYCSVYTLLLHYVIIKGGIEFFANIYKSLSNDDKRSINRLSIEIAGLTKISRPELHKRIANFSIDPNSQFAAPRSLCSTHTELFSCNEPNDSELNKPNSSEQQDFKDEDNKNFDQRDNQCDSSESSTSDKEEDRIIKHNAGGGYLHENSLPKFVNVACSVNYYKSFENSQNYFSSSPVKRPQRLSKPKEALQGDRSPESCNIQKNGSMESDADSSSSNSVGSPLKHSTPCSPVMNSANSLLNSLSNDKENNNLSDVDGADANRIGIIGDNNILSAFLPGGIDDTPELPASSDLDSLSSRHRENYNDSDEGRCAPANAHELDNAATCSSRSGPLGTNVTAQVGDDNLGKDQIIAMLSNNLISLQAKNDQLAKKMEASAVDSQAHIQRIHELLDLVMDKEYMLQGPHGEHEEVRKRWRQKCHELNISMNGDCNIRLPNSLHEQIESMANEINTFRTGLQEVLRTRCINFLELPPGDATLPLLLTQIESAMDQLAGKSGTELSQAHSKDQKVELELAEATDKLNYERQQSKLLCAELEQCQDQLSAHVECMQEVMDQLDVQECKDLQSLLNRSVAEKTQLRLDKAQLGNSSFRTTKLHFICSVNHETLSTENAQVIVQPAGQLEPQDREQLQQQLKQQLMDQIQKCVESKLAESLHQLSFRETLATDLLALLRECNRLPPIGPFLGPAAKFLQLRTQVEQMVDNYNNLKLVKCQPSNRYASRYPTDHDANIKKLMLQVIHDGQDAGQTAAPAADQLSLAINEFASEFKALDSLCGQLQAHLDWNTNECHWLDRQLSNQAEYIRLLESQEPLDKRQQKLTVLLQQLKKQLLGHEQNVNLLNAELIKPCADTQQTAVHQQRLALLTGDLQEQLLQHIECINHIAKQYSQTPELSALDQLNAVQYMEELLSQLHQQLNTQRGQHEKLKLELLSCPPTAADSQSELRTQLEISRQQLNQLNKERLRLDQQLLNVKYAWNVELMRELLPQHQQHVDELQLRLREAHELIGERDDELQSLSKGCHQLKDSLANMQQRLERANRSDCELQVARQQIATLEEMQQEQSTQIESVEHELMLQLQALAGNNREMCLKKQQLDEMFRELREKENQLKTAQAELNEREKERLKLQQRLKNYQQQVKGFQQMLRPSPIRHPSERESILERQLHSAREDIERRTKQCTSFKKQLEVENLRYQMLRGQLRKRSSEQQKRLIEQLKLARFEIQTKASERQLVDKKLLDCQQAVTYLKQDVNKWRTAYRNIANASNNLHQQLQKLQLPDPLLGQKTAHQKLIDTANDYQQQVERLQLQLEEAHKQIDMFSDLDGQQKPHERKCLHERLGKKLANIRERLESLQQALKAKDEQLLDAEQRAAVAVDQAKLMEQLKHACNEILELNAQNQQLHKDLVSYRKQMDELQQQLQQHQELQQQLAVAEKHKEEQDAIQLKLSDKLTDYKNRIETLVDQSGELIRLQDKVSRMKNEISSLQEQLVGLNRTQTELNQQLLASKQQEASLQQKLDEQQKAMQCRDGQLKDLQQLQLVSLQNIEEAKHKQLTIERELQSAEQRVVSPRKMLEEAQLKLHQMQCKVQENISLKQMLISLQANLKAGKEKNSMLLKKQTKLMEEERTRVQKELRKLQKQLEQKELDIDQNADHEKSVEDSTKQPNNQSEFNQLKHSLEQLKMERNKLKSKTDTLQAELITHRELSSLAERKETNLQNEIAHIEQNYSLAAKRVKQLERMLKLSDSKLSKLQMEVDVAEEEKVRLTLEVGSLNSELQQQRNHAAELTSQLQASTSSLKELQQQIYGERSAMDMALQELNCSRLHHHLAIGELNTRIAYLQMKGARIAEREQKALGEQTRLEGELRETTAALTVLRDSHKQLMSDDEKNLKQLEELIAINKKDRAMIKQLQIEYRQLFDKMDQPKQMVNTMSQTVLSSGPTKTGREISVYQYNPE